MSDASNTTVVIKTENLGKSYRLYGDNASRLKSLTLAVFFLYPNTLCDFTAYNFTSFYLGPSIHDTIHDFCWFLLFSAIGTYEGFAI